VPFTFVKVEAGTFAMGSPLTEAHRYPIESQHYVKLTKNFYISTTEITQRQWSAVMGYNPSMLKGEVSLLSMSAGMMFAEEEAFWRE
jgi:formylglycine-generating enzyme required for sulfatase activity